MAAIKNTSPPPKGAEFWELFDFFWVRGLGNDLHADGTSQSWTAASLESAFDGRPDKRSIENWQSRVNIPSQENLRKISALIAGEDTRLRKAWFEALVDARLEEKRRVKETSTVVAEAEPHIKTSNKLRLKVYAAGTAAMVALGGLYLWQTSQPNEYVQNMRICDEAYFDEHTQKCTKHVDVFVHGVDEVFLSFDFNDVKYGAPFERWWIHNGERVAGRTSFNDDAWPGYTFWRPGVLQVGTYVVRLVVAGEVTTQTFYVQAEGFTSDG